MNSRLIVAQVNAMVRYAFEAVEGDTVSTITPSEHDGGYSLNYEARSTAGKQTNKQGSSTFALSNLMIRQAEPGCKNNKGFQEEDQGLPGTHKFPGAG